MTQLWAKEENGELVFSNKRELSNFLSENKGKTFSVTLKRERGVRSDSQNNSIHLYLSQVARELINNGHTLQDVVEKIRKVEITPTTENLKEVVWREIQYAVLKKRLTRGLSKTEVNEVYEPLSMWLAKEFQISLPFPSEQTKNEESI